MPIEKVAVKFHLYVPKGPDGCRDDWLEKKLADLETWFGTSIWNAVCTDFPDLSWNPLRKMLALLVATTYLRNPLQFEQMKNIHRQLVDLISSGPALPGTIAINGVVQPVNLDDWLECRNASEDDLKRGMGRAGQYGWLASGDAIEDALGPSLLGGTGVHHLGQSGDDRASLAQIPRALGPAAAQLQLNDNQRKASCSIQKDPGTGRDYVYCLSPGIGICWEKGHNPVRGQPPHGVDAEIHPELCDDSVEIN